MQNNLNQKLQAARLLGLKVEQNYKIVNGSFFISVDMKKDDIIVSSHIEPADKQKTIEALKQQKINFQKGIIEVDKDLKEIEALNK